MGILNQNQFLINVFYFFGATQKLITVDTCNQSTTNYIKYNKYR